MGTFVRRCAVAGLATVLGVSTLIGSPALAQEAPLSPSGTFPERYSVNAAGDLVITGNTLMTCPTSSSTCAEAQRGGGTSSRFNNNSYSMVMVDIDGDPATKNSSSATLSVPSGAPILFAGLYWGAGASGDQAKGNVPANAGQVLFRTPNSASYEELTALNVFTISTTGSNKTYSAMADVTQRVATAGPGSYTVANVRADVGVNHFAGWSLIVVYADATEPVRAISVYDGLVSVRGGSPATIDVSGFLTPPTGPVRTALGVVAYEGDLGITGDQFTLNGRALGDTIRSTTNFFNSTITTKTGHVTEKEPNYRNQLGFDAGLIDATGRIANSETSARFQASSTGDQYYPVALTFSTELFSPRFSAIKSGVDINGDVLRPGDEIQYTLSLRNDVTIDNGDASTGTVISDVLPAGAQYVPGSLTVNDVPIPDSGSVADINSDSLTIRVGAGADATEGGRLAIGETVTVRYRMRVNESTPGGTSLDNDFSVSGAAATSGFAVTGRSNLVSLNVVANDADLSITKTAINQVPAATQPTTIAGRSAVYEVTVANAGPGSAQSVVVEDTLPTGTTLVSATGVGWSCTGSGAPLRCTRDGLAAGATAPTISVTVAVPPTAATGTSLRNVAQVTSATTDPDPTNNSSDATFLVERRADLAIDKTHVGEAVVGETLTYVVSVANNGPSQATQVVVSDVLPDYLTLITATGDGWTCDDTITCRLYAPLPAGSSAGKILITTQVQPSDQSTVSNTATVSGAEIDPVPNNNSSTDISDKARVVDVIESLSHPGKAIAGGPAIPVLARAYNVGPAAIPTGATVTQTITIPPGTTMGQQSDSQWTCAPASATATTSPVTVVCSHVLTSPWAAETRLRDLTLPIAVAAGETQDKVVTAVVANNSGVIDIDLANNRALDTITVESRADLQLTTTSSADLLAGGPAAPLNFTVRNNGPSTDSGPFVVRFSRLNDLELSPAPGSPWVCLPVDNAMECTLTGVSLAPGTTAAPLALQVRASDPAQSPGSFALTGVVSSPTPDSEPDNNWATAPITVRVSAALVPTKTAEPMRVRAGDNVTFTLAVRNTGPSVARDVSLYDDLGELGLEVVSAVAGSQAVRCQPTIDAIVDCRVAVLDVGAQANVTVVARTNPSWTTPNRTFTNTLSVSTSSPGPVPSVATVDVVTDPYSVLELGKSARGVANGGALIAGADVVYDLVVRNTGPTNAVGVTITDELPTVFTPIVAVGDGWQCTIAGQRITCTSTADIPVGAALPTLSIKANLAHDAEGSITNRATVTPTSPGDPANAEVVHTVRDVVDLGVAHFGPTLLESGERWQTQVVVRNNGPADEPGPIRVTVEQTGGATPIPPRVSGDGWDCTVVDVQVRCVTPSSLTFGASLPPISIVSSTSGQSTQVNSRAIVTGSAEDIDRTNNRSSTTAVLERPVDLVIQKRAVKRTVPAGGLVTYHLTVKNNGPGAAGDAQARDVLPAGLTWLPKRSDPRCTNENNAIQCSVEGTLARGEATRFTIVARVGASVRGTVVNTARVSSSQPDTNPRNNRSRATITVTPPVQQQVPLVDPPTRIRPTGTTVIYPGPVPTNAGQRARVSVTCQPLLRDSRGVLRGDFQYCRVIRGANGSIAVSVTGRIPVSVTVRVTAPAKSGYSAMDIRYRYSTGAR
jgi:uncharacterized repeat protein (TIGR01451 family)